MATCRVAHCHMTSTSSSYYYILVITIIVLGSSSNAFRKFSGEENQELNLRFGSWLDSNPGLNLGSVLTGSGSNLGSEPNPPITTCQRQLVRAPSLWTLYRSTLWRNVSILTLLGAAERGGMQEWNGCGPAEYASEAHLGGEMLAEDMGIDGTGCDEGSHMWA
jgi:hypothetical protein